jgi:carboxyl-terminal processing protease
MKTFNTFQKYLVITLAGISLFFVGFYFGKQGLDAKFIKKDYKVEITRKDPPAKEVDFALFWEVWETLNSTYLERPLDAQKMVYGAIKGMVESLEDPYTSFLPPAQNEQAEASLNGTYEGIGAELGSKENQIIVISPFDGSPAKEAGIRPGDAILRVDDKGTSGMTVTDVVKLIRGDAGTVVKLTIGRAGEKDSITWEDKKNGIAYIRISRFGDDTNKLWDESVAKINTEMPDINAVIVDVRGNPGGYLDSAIHIAGEFFTDKPVIYEEYASGKQVERSTERIGSLNGVPVVVLIDEGSASASEILAAALRDNAGAVLVGQKSFGKGTIQDVRNFEDGSGVHITIAKWLTPNKEWVHEKGIEPKIKVEVTSEDIEADKDPQLDKAKNF